MFEALCWGGPMEGQYIAAEYSPLRAVREKPRNMRMLPVDTTGPVDIGWGEDNYNYEQFSYGPLLFGAWVISAPQERREAIHETIIGGLNLMAWMANPLGHEWRVF